MGNKKYFWLKLKEDFFTSRLIKKLRKSAGGDTCLVIYQRLLLLSLKNNGEIIFERTEDDIVSQISIELDEKNEDVKHTLAFLEQNNLVEQGEQGGVVLEQVVLLTGSETDTAERMRKMREKRNIVTQQLHTVTQRLQGGYKNVTTDIEKEIEIDKEIDKDKETDKETKPPTPKKQKKPKEAKRNFAEFVFLTETEYQSLLNNPLLGSQTAVNECIQILDNYKGSNGKIYKSDYRAILSWVVERYCERKSKSRGNDFVASARAAQEMLDRGEIIDL